MEALQVRSLVITPTCRQLGRCVAALHVALPLALALTLALPLTLALALPVGACGESGA